MSDNPEQEPSIEEILSSIRQIISDDDDEVVEPEPAPEPEVEPEPEPEEDDDVLELTDKVEDDPPPRPAAMEIDMQDSEDDDDDDDFDLDGDDDSLLTDSAEGAAFEGFAALASKAALDRRGKGDTTIEDIVRELMKPMLREWLDVHLPPLIEKVVKRELQKVAKRATGDD